MSIKKKDQQEIKKMSKSMEQSNKTFYFGETPYLSRGILKLPCKIGEHKFYIKTEILKGDIPWLIGRETMENMDMVINVKKEKVKLGELNRMEAKIRIDNKGHLRLGMGIETADKIWRGEEWSDVRAERHKKLWNLHLQFGHPGWERLWKLLEEANDGYEEDKERASNVCSVQVVGVPSRKGCKLHTPIPDSVRSLSGCRFFGEANRESRLARLAAKAGGGH